VQFHTGLGDNDIALALASPAHMQPIIRAYPNAQFVLLHSSYPYTRDAGYLTAVYANVFLDFGEVFPFVSASGQSAVVQQVLELAPTNKIMWSSTSPPWFFFFLSLPFAHWLWWLQPTGIGGRNHTTWARDKRARCCGRSVVF
jgi:predicted TIM-barrel fold metal-dependent hydrolase